MARYIIPAGTPVEIRDRGIGLWVPTTTAKAIEFGNYLSWGLGRFVFRDGERFLRVQTKLVKGDWGKS